jgi:hypothetical protein
MALGSVTRHNNRQGREAKWLDYSFLITLNPLKSSSLTNRKRALHGWKVDYFHLSSRRRWLVIRKNISRLVSKDKSEYATSTSEICLGPVIVNIIVELFGVFYSINFCALYGKFKLETSHQQQQEFKYEMFPWSSVLQSMKFCCAEHEVLFCRAWSSVLQTMKFCTYY